MVNTPKFQKSWSNAKKNIFRLEALPEYRIKSDLENFKKFEKRESYIGLKERNWFKQIKKAKQNGVKVQRVRIVSLPFSNYLKYEIDFWKYSTRYGEKILFLLNGDYEKMASALKSKPKDFWMFDNKILIIFHYNKKGNWIREEIINDNKSRNKYKKLKEMLLRQSIPMKKFLKNLTST